MRESAGQAWRPRLVALDIDGTVVDRNGLLLRTVADLCSHLEVRARSSAEWQHAILRSFEIWRHLRDNRGGLSLLVRDDWSGEARDPAWRSGAGGGDGPGPAPGQAADGSGAATICQPFGNAVCQ